MQERVEPFGCAIITNNPCEVDLGQSGGLRVVQIVHAIPNGLEDAAKGERKEKKKHQYLHINIGQKFWTDEAKGVTPIPAPTRRTVS